jgi:short subunit dehydrogenase-like uncharacterized protein
MAEAVGGDFLLYGSYGYTGQLIAERALAAGLRPLLAGRDAGRVERQATELALPWRAFALQDSSELERALGTVPLVLHAAGPFSRTWRPMAEACLRTGTHYLDITGEIEVFEALAALDDRARARGVMLLPGTGFDVVPTDCLAVHLAGQLPGATHLALAFQSGGGVSRGTARTVVENLGRGGMVRREGRLERVPLAWRTRRVDFGEGEVAVTTIPWGDVSTAYRSTGIPHIEVYTRMPRAARRAMVFSRRLGWLLGSGPVRRFLRSRVDARGPGPDPDRRARSEARVWGEVRDTAGNRRTARMRTPDGYTLTALAAVELVRRGLRDPRPGFTTPGLAYGPDWVLELPGVRREDG